MTNVNSYFFKGVKAVNDVYQYDKLPANDKNQVNAFQASNQYNGVAGAPAPVGNKKTVIVDNAVRIQTVHDHVRQAAQAEWTRLKAQSKKTFVATLITGIVAVIAGIAAGVAAFTFPPLLIAAIPVFLLGVSLLITAGRSHSNMKTSQNELDKWKDPVQVAVEHRRNGGAQGFYYTLNNQLKNTYFHSEEVKALWYDEVEKYIQQYKVEDDELAVQLKSDVKLIKTFFDRNPLQKLSVDYAFEQNVPGEIKDISKSFRLVEKRYTDLRQETENQRKAIKDRQQEAIDTLQEQKDDRLGPITQAYRTRDVQLKLQRSQLMADSRVPESRKQQGLRTLNAQITQNDMTYQAIRRPIDTWFAKESRKVNDWARDELKAIQVTEDKEILKFQKPMAKLIERYRLIGLEEQQPSVPSAPLYPDVKGLLDNIGYDAPSAPPLEDLEEPDDAYNAYLVPPQAN